VRLSSVRRLWTKLRGLLGAAAPSEFDDEVLEHLRLLTERYVRHGMTPEEASAAARRQFGNMAVLREDRREMQTVVAIETVARDIAYAARTLRRSPAFAGAVVLTLALGIGANTAIFSVYDAVVMKPLPYADPERLVMLWEQQRDGSLGTVAPANFLDWRAQSHSFTDMAAFAAPSFILTGNHEPARLQGAAVSSSFFRLLGVSMAVGRSFADSEDAPGKNRVAIVSDRAWRQYLGGRPEIIGSAIALNDVFYTVVGVLPPDFELVTRQARSQPDFWIPLGLDARRAQRGTHPFRVFARVRPGLSDSHVQADLNVVAANLSRLYPEEDKDKGIVAVRLPQQVTQNVRTAVTTLLAGVGLLLLIACANVANLLLSRAAARQKEIAVRLALGASRRRLAQQLLTESLVLAVLGGVAGLGLAFAAVQLLRSHLPADLPRASALAIDLRVMGFTAFMSLATGVLFGAAPLLQTGGERGNDVLKQQGRSVTVGSRLRNALVVGQIALALILLTGAGLTAKSFWTLLRVSPGFRVDHVLTARVSLPAGRYADEPRVSLFQSELLRRLHGLPGVQSAGLTAYLPLSGDDNGWAFFIEGRPPLPVGVYNMANYRPVSPGYLETIGIPVLRGRGLTQADGERDPWVVVINESMARTYWGTENPVGQRLRFAGVPRAIVGVVGNVRHQALDGEPKAEMYVPRLRLLSRACGRRSATSTAPCRSIASK
jgi:predicted permease